MQLPYPAEGIILASDDFKEKDRILTIYTKEFGKIKAISRGARKINSKLAPHLGVLSHLNLMLFNGKSIATLTGAFEIESFNKLKNKADNLLVALYLVELVNRITFENLPDEKIFNLLLSLLKYLDKDILQNEYKIRPDEIILIFKIKILNLLGLLPGIKEAGASRNFVFRAIKTDFDEFKKSDLSGIIKEKLNKVLNYSFGDITSKNNFKAVDYFKS